MTYKKLKKIINLMPESMLRKQVQIFDFNNGDLSELNEVNLVGDRPDIESHCSNIDDGELKPGSPYLLCNYC